MNRFKNIWNAALLLGALAMSSCALDTPEYPDNDFTIVGTWEYHVPAWEGSTTPAGVYNVDGRITFTEDLRFCFTLDTDRGEVKGHGTYVYHEDTGIVLVYEGYRDKVQLAYDKGYIKGKPDLGDANAIGWGWSSSDRVEDDYLKVHTTVPEYFRISTLPFEEEVRPYLSGDGTYYYVGHNGASFLAVPEWL